jgi:uroporphyrin-III C-methyltransferase/precorrin-2 dehydrogenase/sirohydrochlorin ferrochelatase
MFASNEGIANAPHASARPLFPTFLRLEGRRVLIVGGGAVACGKLTGLLDAGARVIVVAPDIRPALEQPGVALVRAPFSPAHLEGVWFVVAAAPPEVNRVVALHAERRGIFVNAVDDRGSASAYAAGVVRRGALTLAISTGGAAPALAGLLREALEAVIPCDLAVWLEEARAARAAWKVSGVPMGERRPLLLQALNRLYEFPRQERAP